ncbi:MAG: DUF4350 domain-containing protein [Chitinophagaceae bacterium]|nr:MAG: DUF4350 domain-containing protein [Chitinophagaceae bacterium]
MIGAVIAVFLLNNRWGIRQKQLNERVTWNKADKIPYGLNAAYTNLSFLFPKAQITINKKDPGSWESVSPYLSGQAALIITPEFNADDYELKQLHRFVEAGNDVFISAISLSSEALAFFNCTVVEGQSMYTPTEFIPDTLTLKLDSTVFPTPATFSFPGKNYSSYFSGTDNSAAIIQGTDASGHPDFIRLRAGSGNFYLHLAPVAFTNYFILHKANMAYYEKLMSLIPAGTSKILWDEYYRTKKASDSNNPKKNWLTVLMNIKNSEGKKPFKAALLAAFFLILAYVLLGIRRKQRVIPIIKKEANATLDFTKTVGRLYHDKGDHANLARKMTAYFLEHVRSRYKLVTTTLNDEFINQLHFKTGVELPLITEIVQSIQTMEHNQVSPAQLAAFHKQLETFYKTA